MLSPVATRSECILNWEERAFNEKVKTIWETLGDELLKKEPMKFDELVDRLKSLNVLQIKELEFQFKIFPRDDMRHLMGIILVERLKKLKK